MVISQVDTDEVVERWQFDIQCEKSEQTENKEGTGFVSASINPFLRVNTGEQIQMHSCDKFDKGESS